MQGLADEQLGAYLDRLDRPGDASLQHEADGKDRYPEPEQGAAAEQRQADPDDRIRRGAHDGSEDAADRARRQLVASRLPGLGRLAGLHTDNAGGHRDVAHHQDAENDAQQEREPAEPPSWREDGGNSKPQT